jgi:hypothetical protein
LEHLHWQKSLKATAGSQKIGPAIVLKVMAGDKFNIRANSCYKTYGNSLGTTGIL